jgi:hypothetical protein
LTPLVPPSHRPRSQDGRGFLHEPLPAPGEARHRVTTLLRDADGQPTLAGPAIKGMLRSWFEVITSSQRDIDPSGVAWRYMVIDSTRDDHVGRSVRPCSWNAGS